MDSLYFINIHLLGNCRSLLKEAEKAAKEAERAQKEAAREAEKKKKEAERAKKNSIEYKLGKKVANKATDKLINKGLNTLMKHFFK